ncbi:MAG TPA: hypothetical protein PK605_11670 [Ignavibacteria bacterium]|nr:hypothetical protein [Ignavibacteria bacterium]HRF65079.1 hypothetical protein [Ignavibacteria bacterium]HRJ05052.1 hypothetical protein [Ignavibacteria bacterium]HRJ85216.1 hypothetical protein [Ignavibacteria bacterium]
MNKLPCTKVEKRCNHSQDMIWIFIDGKVCANINCEKYFEDVIESQDTEFLAKLKISKMILKITKEEH